MTELAGYTSLSPFYNIKYSLGHELLGASVVDVGTLQSKDISDIPQLVTNELVAVTLTTSISGNQADWAQMCEANLPWAEDHFQERVSGVPLNPGNEYTNWPWFKGNVEKHQHVDGAKFSHSYMERIWPKHADGFNDGHMGIRYKYGDLNDVVALLEDHPRTRQAWLPIWFPEDTGAGDDHRVPCSIGYQFLMRDHKLHVFYTIRSCDFVRHFSDDVYMAGRLGHWVLRQLHHSAVTDAWDDVEIGNLYMNINSLHCFQGDLPMMRRKYAPQS